jgi:hypothetical protein
MVRMQCSMDILAAKMPSFAHREEFDGWRSQSVHSYCELAKIVKGCVTRCELCDMIVNISVLRVSVPWRHLCLSYWNT